MIFGNFLKKNSLLSHSVDLCISAVKVIGVNAGVVGFSTEFDSNWTDEFPVSKRSEVLVSK